MENFGAGSRVKKHVGYGNTATAEARRETRSESNALRFGTLWNGWNAVERVERCGTRIFSRFLTVGDTKLHNDALRFGKMWNGWNAMERLERGGTASVLFRNSDVVCV